MSSQPQYLYQLWPHGLGRTLTAQKVWWSAGEPIKASWAGISLTDSPGRWFIITTVDFTKISHVTGHSLQDWPTVSFHLSLNQDGGNLKSSTLCAWLIFFELICIWIISHFYVLKWHRKLQSFLVECTDPAILAPPGHQQRCYSLWTISIHGSLLSMKKEWNCTQYDRKWKYISMSPTNNSVNEGLTYRGQVMQ